jgi:hypothetical protein
MVALGRKLDLLPLKKEKAKKARINYNNEGIFGFSKAIVGDSCPGGPVCHVRVTCCTIPLILTRFWAQGVTAVQLD